MADKPHASDNTAHNADDRRGRRICPWCGSADVRLVHRGFTGPTDERDQYITCESCSRLTYEIVSRNAREMRLGQYRAGGTYRDSLRQTKYDIQRVLRVGPNEVLLYVKPIVRHAPSQQTGSPRRGRY